VNNMESKSIQYFLGAFFNDLMIKQRGASPHTIASYSDTFQLILQYAAEKLKKTPVNITLNDINANFLCQFLDDLEENRRICARTRNARLVAIRSFFHFLSYRLPEYLGLINEVLAIPEKRMEQKLIDFLTKAEAAALLGAPNQKTWVGKRDHTFLVVAIQTGMRLAELISLKWEDVHLEQDAYIHCLGKGRKNRITPLSEEAIKCLRLWSKEVNSSLVDIVFPTNRGSRMSPDAVQYMLKKYTGIAGKYCRSLTSKRVTPHVLRHTTAMRLIEKGIDLFSIALWLGHASIKTTYVYLRADMEMKKNILKKLPSLNTKTKRYKPKDKIMVFLKSLSNPNMNVKEKKKGAN